MYTVELVTSEAQKSEVFRQRYRIYVEEMGRHQVHADHVRREIREPMDEQGAIFAAYTGNELLGSLRVNLARDGALECPELYAFEQFGSAFPDKVSLLTKLMVERNHRSTVVFNLLAISAYEYGLRSGITHNFINCNDHLVRSFERLGHRTYKGKVSHPEYGNVTPMVCIVHDREYMEQMRSPLLRTLDMFLQKAAQTQLSRDAV